MTEPPVKPRHYTKPADLVRRSEGDISVEGMGRRIRAGWLLEESRAVRPENPSLVSSAHGAFERLLLALPAYAAHDPSLSAAYQDLLANLPTPRLVVLTHESVAPVVAGWLEGSGREGSSEVVKAPDHLHFSVWAEDGYVVVRDTTEATFLVEPFAFPRYGDGLIADFVSNATDLKSTQAPLYFQGGNVLVGDDFFLIGADYPANSLEYISRVIVPDPGETPAALVRRLYRDYFDHRRALHYVGSTIPVPQQQSREIDVNGERWTELLYVGNREGTVQPLFHIDMFITLAGRDEDGGYQLLVGDPREAARLLNTPLPPQAMAEVFDNIAQGLTRLGFTVQRNPLPLVYVDDESRRERVWYFATSNNALVEITDQDKTVWLPTYGHGSWSELRVTDDANAQQWSRLGFEVVQLGDFHPFAENPGCRPLHQEVSRALHPALWGGGSAP